VQPFSPARLLAVKEIPTGRSWLYEPKFDGYRGLLVSGAGGRGSVWSRNGKDLGRYFPELVDLAARLPADTVIDGEIVRPIETGVSFIQLQRRLMTPIKELRSTAREWPAAFVAFDLMRWVEDLRPLKLSERRARLEGLVAKQGDSLLQLMLQTSNVDTAAAWLDDGLSIAGIEGVVAKLNEPYPKPEARRWRKVRRMLTREFAVQGFIPEGQKSMRLVLAVDDDGESRIVGTTYPIAGDDAAPVLSLIPRAAVSDRRIWAPFEDGRHDAWFQVPAGLVAEVVITNLDSNLLRQPARFVRWRLTEPSPLL